MEVFKGVPVLLFESQQPWHDWLDARCTEAQGVWLKFAKKSSHRLSITYDQALEEALCYGWIDSQKRTYDEDYWLQKFTPRSPRSVWSKVNVVKVEALIEAKRVQPMGLAAMEIAKQSGAWQAAYDSSSMNTIPDDFQAALNKNPEAKQFFEALDKANVYAFCWRIQTAKKPETRQARIEKFIAMLNRGEKLH